MQARFGKALDRLRQSEAPAGRSVSDQLRLLDDPPAETSRPSRLTTMPLPEGREERNSSGSHYVIRRRYPGNRFHGKVRLDQIDADELLCLLRLAGRGMGAVDIERIAFLDTETTGVHGGAGMCPFLIGVGYFRGGDFEVVQYFIRDFHEEASMLLALEGLLSAFELLVTYNGQSFDVPLVENRCVLSRCTSPFGRMAHLDLLFMARRLWRAGHGSCRLTALEQEILGFFRGPDIPGAEIPRAYFDYLASSDAISLRSVFSHHVDDILSLAALTIHAAARVVREPLRFDDPLDLYSLGRLFDHARDYEKCVRFYELALEGGLGYEVRVRVMERLSVLYRRGGDLSRSMQMCGQLMVLDQCNLVGYEGAAMLHEHQERDLKAACAVIGEGLDKLEQADRRGARLRARLERLRKKSGGTLFEDQPAPASAGDGVDGPEDRPAAKSGPTGRPERR